MSWELKNKKSSFFEAVIQFTGESKYTDEDGKTCYKTSLEKELFDGIVIFMDDVLDNPWSPTIFEIEQNIFEKKSKIREIHKQGLLISLYNDIVFKTMATDSIATYRNSQLTQYAAPEKLDIKTESIIQYIMCEHKSMYLFVHTDLENSSFDLNMNIRVKESMELFKQDLTLVHSAIGEIEPIVKMLNEKNIEK
jgi:hypothetical protein